MLWWKRRVGRGFESLDPTQRSREAKEILGWESCPHPVEELEGGAAASAAFVRVSNGRGEEVLATVWCPWMPTSSAEGKCG